MTVSKISVNLKEALGYYNKGTTIPQNTNTNGTTNLQTGQTNGQLEIVMSAATAIALADTKIITLTVTSSATVAGTFTEVGTATYTASGATTFAIDEEILTFVIPTSEKVLEFTKVNVATDDAAATGTYDVALRYIVS
jgi:hypothetical protein